MISKMYARGRVTEVSACISQLFEAYQNSTIATDEKIGPFFTKMETLNSNLIDTFHQVQMKSKLLDKDDVLDASIRTLNGFIIGASCNPNAAIKDPAMVLKEVIDGYGMGILAESYAIQSTLVKSLFRDLSTPEMQAHVAVIPACADVLQAAKDAYSEFENTRLEQEVAKAKEKDTVIASKVRDDLVSLYNEIIYFYLMGQIVINDPDFVAFGKIADQIVSKYNASVKNRLKNKDTDE